MNAVAKKFPAGELDLRAFKAGNDIMLFFKTFQTKSFDKISFRKRRNHRKPPHGKCKENSENQIFIRTSKFKIHKPENINEDLNNNTSRAELSEKLYVNAITLLKDEKKSFCL